MLGIHSKPDCFSSDFFGKSPELLQRLSECSEDSVSMVDLLVALFYLPAQHLPEYSRLLLKLATCFEVVGALCLPDGAGGRCQNQRVVC